MRMQNKFSHHNNQHHAHKPGAEGQVGAPASNPQGAASLASDGAGATASAAEGAGQAQTDLDQVRPQQAPQKSNARISAEQCLDLLSLHAQECSWHKTAVYHVSGSKESIAMCNE